LVAEAELGLALLKDEVEDLDILLVLEPMEAVAVVLLTEQYLHLHQ
jgi:hypothetical protein